MIEAVLLSLMSTPNVLLGCAYTCLHEVGELKYIGSMFIANGWGTEESKSRIYLAHSLVAA